MTTKPIPAHITPYAVAKFLEKNGINLITIKPIGNCPDTRAADRLDALSYSALIAGRGNGHTTLGGLDNE